VPQLDRCVEYDGSSRECGLCRGRQTKQHEFLVKGAGIRVMVQGIVLSGYTSDV
jgi:hypothetical protein